MPELLHKFDIMIRKQRNDIMASFYNGGDYRLSSTMNHCLKNRTIWELMSEEKKEKNFAKFIAGPKTIPNLVTSQDGHETLENITTSAKKKNQKKIAKGPTTTTLPKKRKEPPSPKSVDPKLQHLNLSALKNDELRQICKDNQLATSGTKPKLLNRLYSHNIGTAPENADDQSATEAQSDESMESMNEDDKDSDNVTHENVLEFVKNRVNQTLKHFGGNTGNSAERDLNE